MPYTNGLHHWDELKVGDNIGTIQYHITKSDVIRFISSLDNVDIWYTDTSPFGYPIVPACYFCDDYLRLLTQYIDYPLDVLHSKFEHESKGPICQNTLITVTGTIIDKFTKRHRNHIVVETVATGENGLELSRDRNILSRPIKEMLEDEP